jgi:hypothetical protein
LSASGGYVSCTFTSVVLHLIKIENYLNITKERILIKTKNLSLIFRIILIITVVCLLISSIIIIILGDELYDVNSSEIGATFVWITVMAGIWITLLAIITLAIIVINYRFKKLEFWKLYKVDTYLTLGLIASLLSVYLSNLIIWTR